MARGEVMQRGCGVSLLFVMLLYSPAGSQSPRPTPGERYTVAFASVAPLDTDLFIAAGDGSDARPFLAHPDLDRVDIDGASLQRLTDDPAFDDQGVLSSDGRSLAFVSSRSGQADIWIL